MNMYEEVLSKEHKELIEAWISDYATDEVNGHNSRASLGHILRYWNSNKENLFRMFGSNLILSKQVMIAKENGDMEREIGDSMYARNDEKSMWKFYNACSNYVDYHWREMECDRWNIMDLFGSYCLVRNQWTGNNFTIKTPDGKAIQVQNGCKPMKILGKIAQVFGIEGFEEFRLAHSRILNQKMMKGELCLSIHPMDYMTMSDNDCDWDSCMSWRNGGCYRRGTVEMMNSNCVVVAYLRASEDMRFYDKYWNNKKWRQLFVVTPECIVGVKGYPYCHNGLADACINWLAELAAENLKWEYKPTVYDMEHEHWFKVDGESWKFRFYTHTMYNDFGTCPHRIRVAANPDTVYEHMYTIDYSGEEVCMWCGDSCADFDGEEPLTCNSCSDYIWCSCCEERVSSDGTVEVDGTWYCRYCYDEHVVEDPISGYEHHESDMMTLHCVPDDYPEEKISARECDYTIAVNHYDLTERVNNDTFSRYFTIDPNKREFHRFGAFWRDLYYVRLSELTEEGRELFDLCDESDMEWFLKHHER